MPVDSCVTQLMLSARIGVICDQKQRTQLKPRWKLVVSLPRRRRQSNLRGEFVKIPAAGLDAGNYYLRHDTSLHAASAHKTSPMARPWKSSESRRRNDLISDKQEMLCPRQSQQRTHCLSRASMRGYLSRRWKKSFQLYVIWAVRISLNS